MSLYCTRDAGLNWSREVESTMKSLEFQKGLASACCYRHAGRKIYVTVRGDDFLIAASANDLK